MIPGLFLIDVSLCDNRTEAPDEYVARLAPQWRSGGLARVEAPSAVLAAGIASLLKDLGLPYAACCLPAPEEVALAATHEAAGVTFWAESALQLARRQPGASHPNSAIQLRRAVQEARDSGLDVTVAFRWEEHRARTLLNFGYLAQSCGAQRMRLVDDSGVVHPLDVFRTIRVLRERLTIPLEVDISNSYGVAVGAALCAIRAGIHYIAVTGDPDSRGPHIPLSPLRTCVEGTSPLIEKMSSEALSW